MGKYRTVQGDMWDMIALKVYGKEQLMYVLIEANPQHRNTSVFSANCEINIPETPTVESVTFPPWRAR